MARGNLSRLWTPDYTRQQVPAQLTLRVISLEVLSQKVVRVLPINEYKHPQIGALLGPFVDQRWLWIWGLNRERYGHYVGEFVVPYRCR